MLFCHGFKNTIAIFVFCIHCLQVVNTKWKKNQFGRRKVVGQATMFAHWAQKVTATDAGFSSVIHAVLPNRIPRIYGPQILKSNFSDYSKQRKVEDKG